MNYDPLIADATKAQGLKRHKTQRKNVSPCVTVLLTRGKDSSKKTYINNLLIMRGKILLPIGNV